MSYNDSIMLLLKLLNVLNVLPNLLSSDFIARYRLLRRWILGVWFEKISDQRMMFYLSKPILSKSNTQDQTQISICQKSSLPKSNIMQCNKSVLWLVFLRIWKRNIARRWSSFKITEQNISMYNGYSKY